MPESASPTNSVQQLVDTALTILKEHGGAPVMVKGLGQMIVARTRVPIRQVLGAKSLGPFLERELEGKAVLTGDGAERCLSLAVEGAQPTRMHFRFEPSVFSAFSKPLAAGKRRFLTASRPFKFVDTEEPAESDALEVLPEDIAAIDIPKPERRAVIERNIETWCARHKVAPGGLLFEPGLPKAARTSIAVGAVGIDVLKQLIAAIPAEERKNFSLQMDLLARLLEI